MILVDTSVWIDHLHSQEAELVQNLDSSNVLMHAMVIGELSCGHIRGRSQQLAEWQQMPMAARLSDGEICAKIESLRLMGRGISFIDAHLLCSVLARRDTLLWTRDRRLREVAIDLAVAFWERGKKGEENGKAN